MRRNAPALAHMLALAACPLLCSSAYGQQDTPQQQPPAPIVRIRPRPQTPPPTDAPPDAAPLVARPPRPRPINPQALSGATAPSGQTASPATPRPHPGTAATGPTTPKLARTPSSTPSPATASTQPPSTPAETPRPTPKPTLSPLLNRNYIVLDPSHGGTDSGSRIGDSTLEKNVTLSLAFHLRSLLSARGFTVVLTREGDTLTQPNTPNTPLTLDDRAGIANHFRPAACLLLHATGRGTGVHLYTSELEPAPGEALPAPWLTGQAAWMPASQQLERSVGSALGRSHIPLVSSAASVRPVDSLTCPALVLELSPETSDPGSINGVGYQERVAAAVAGALVFWQNQVQPPAKLTTGLPAATAIKHHHAPRPATPAQPTPEPTPNPARDRPQEPQP